MLVAELPDVALFGAVDRYGDLGIHAIVDLRRRFGREALEAAVRATLAAYPVLGCRYVPGFWRDRWVKVDAPLSAAVHVEDPGPADLEALTETWVRRPIDATRERPLRVVSLARGAGCRLIFSISHLAVDGAGAAAVGHVLGSHLYGSEPSAPIDARRDVGSALEGLRWHQLPLLVRDAAVTAALPLGTYRAARRERPFAVSPRAPAHWRHLTFTAAEVEALKARCRPRGASINDVLIAALARVAASRSSRGPLAVMYTMDLRRFAGAPRLTAANTSSILSVNVPRSAVGDLATAAEAVSRVTARQQRSLMGPAFLVLPLVLGVGAPHAWVRRVTRWLHPVLIDMPLRRGVVFTNVGRIDTGLSSFGADVESVRVVGPTVTGMEAPAVVAFGYRGELHLQLFAAPGLAPSALDELAAELCDALELPRRGAA